ncbi:MAG: DUF4124 domain-containing protein [Steroidobacteraceae bacterium]
MNQRQLFTALVSLTAGMLLFAGVTHGAEGKRAYKWVDRNGVTHYGDSIPPEYASQGHEELNSQGVPVRETARQLNPLEAARAQEQAAEQQRLRQHDSFLTSTYTKVADIEQLRDERVALVAAQLELARGSLAAADQRLGTLSERMNNFRPYATAPSARRVPDQLAEELVRALSDRRSMQTTVDQRQQEMLALRTSFEADIARFRELTSRPASR